MAKAKTGKDGGLTIYEPKTHADMVGLVMRGGGYEFGCGLDADTAEAIAGNLLDAAKVKRQLDQAAAKGLDALRGAALMAAALPHD